MSADSIITLRGLTVGYPRRPVLQDVNLALARGSLTGLLGANGTGKTTLLKTILGLLPPLAGAVVREPIRDGAGSRSPVFGYVPQREVLDPLFLFSVSEVVTMGTYGRVRAGAPVPRAERDFALHCLELTNAASLAGKPFSILSGGQKQRVLIARALAARPDMLILDEPTAGIDAAAAQSIMELLTRLHAESALTVLMVNHDLRTMRQQVAEVIWLRHDRLEHGPAREMLSPERLEELLELQ